MMQQRIVREKINIPMPTKGGTETTIRCELDRLEDTANTSRDASSCVVLCHGQWSSLYDPLLLSISEGILKGDLDPASIPIDSTCTANNKKEKKNAIEVVRFSFSTAASEPFSGYHKESRELSHVVDFLEDKLDKKVSCIVGHSKAATVICLYAAHHRCRLGSLGLVCISGRFEFMKLDGVSRSIGAEIVDCVLSSGSPQLVEIQSPKRREPFWLTRERLEERASIDMRREIANLKLNKRSEGEEGKSGNRHHVMFFCVVHGGMDERIPVSVAHQYAEAFNQAGFNQEDKAATKCQLRIIQEANHCFTKPQHRQEMVNFVSRVVHQQIHPAR
jgi:dienelactone hydrolase